MNPTGLALDRAGDLFVSCRHDGTIHRVTPDGRARAVDRRHGHRHRASRSIASGIFLSATAAARFSRSARSREIFVFATLEPSDRRVSSGVSSQRRSVCFRARRLPAIDRVYRITQGGEVSVFFRGLGRPQGLAFDRDGNLYVAASLRRTPRHRAHHAAGQPTRRSAAPAWSAWRCCPRAARSRHHRAPSSPSTGTVAAALPLLG